MAQLIAEEMTLQGLRRARKLTQVRTAKALGIGQDGVSKLEKRADPMISTLRKTVEAMGGIFLLWLNSPTTILSSHPVLPKSSRIPNRPARGMPTPTRSRKTIYLPNDPMPPVSAESLVTFGGSEDRPSESSYGSAASRVSSARRPIAACAPI